MVLPEEPQFGGSIWLRRTATTLIHIVFFIDSVRPGTEIWAEQLAIESWFYPLFSHSNKIFMQARSSQSEALKLTKYNKLMKLYQDIKAKKKKIEDRANELTEKKKICSGLE